MSGIAELSVTPVVVVYGHHVVYTVAASLMVVVAVETIAGEAVSEQTPDSQEVTVIKVVCFVGSVVETGHHVVYSVCLLYTSRCV